MPRLVFAALILLAGMNTNGGMYTLSHSSEKMIAITVNEIGQAIMGKDTLTLDQLTIELQKRLWKSYMGTGKMYDAIHLQFTGEVPVIVKDAAIDAIKQAQKNALTEICLEKHKKLFDTLSGGQQTRIKKQFPVLFQSDFQ